MTGKKHPKPKDWMKEFRGKAKLNEREVNLMKLRMGRGILKPSQMRKRGYALTESQQNKGLTWLRKKWKKMGYRELVAVGAKWKNLWDRRAMVKPQWKSMKSVTIRLTGFHLQRSGGRVIFAYPVYRVSCGGDSFEYFVRFGEINIYG